MSFSDNSDAYSDQIDSDLETKLYSLIHHESVEESLDLSFKSNKAPECKITEDRTSSKYENFFTSNGNKFSNDEVYDESLYLSFESNKNSNIKYLQNSSLRETFQNKTKLVSKTYISSVKMAKPSSRKRTSDSVVDYPNKPPLKKIANSSFSSNSPKLQDNLEKEMKNKSTKTSDTDSDSDESVIFCEFNKDTDLKINVDTVVLSSDEKSDSDSETFSFQMNPSMPRQENHNIDPWYVNNEDLYRSPRVSNRYHSKMSLKCANCNERGHNARDCRVQKKMKCFICGDSHFHDKCRNRICPKCLRRGHGFKNCYQDPIYCSHCRMFNHSNKNCPDIWRKYHLTTNNSNPVSGKLLIQDTPIYCFNCGMNGHFGPECTNLRLNDSLCPTWPVVISYNYKPPNLPKRNEVFKQKAKKVNQKKRLAEANMQRKKMEMRLERSKKLLKKIRQQRENRMLVKDISFPRTPKNCNRNGEKFEFIPFSNMVFDSKALTLLEKMDQKGLRRIRRRQSRKQKRIQKSKINFKDS